MGRPPQNPANSSAGSDSRRIRSPAHRPAQQLDRMPGRQGPTSSRRAPSGISPVNRRRLVTRTTVDADAGNNGLT